VHTVTPAPQAAEEQLEQEFTGPVVRTVVGASGAPSIRTTSTPVADSDQLARGT